MAQVLIVYGTAYGQAERIARRILGDLERQGHTVSTFKGDELPADLWLGKYQAFVIAASVIRNQHQRYIRDFVRYHAAQLNRVPPRSCRCAERQRHHRSRPGCMWRPFSARPGCGLRSSRALPVP